MHCIYLVIDNKHLPGDCKLKFTMCILIALKTSFYYAPNLVPSVRKLSVILKLQNYQYFTGKLPVNYRRIGLFFLFVLDLSGLQTYWSDKISYSVL